MATSDEIKRKALELSEKTDSNSISPKEVGGIMHDLASLGENAIRNGGTLGIRKVYTSVSVMEADKNPKDFWGNPMKKGNLVLIYDGTTTGLDNNKIYVYMNPGWEFATYLDAGYPTRQEFSELGSEVSGVSSKVGLSLYDSSIFIENHYIDNVKGNIDPASTYDCTKKIKANKSIIIGGSKITRGCSIISFNLDGEVIENRTFSVETEGTTLELPNGTTYIGFNFTKGQIEDNAHHNLWILSNSNILDSQKAIKEKITEFSSLSSNVFSSLDYENGEVFAKVIKNLYIYTDTASLDSAKPTKIRKINKKSDGTTVISFIWDGGNFDATILSKSGKQVVRSSAYNVMLYIESSFEGIEDGVYEGVNILSEQCYEFDSNYWQNFTSKYGILRTESISIKSGNDRILLLIGIDIKEGESFYIRIKSDVNYKRIILVANETDTRVFDGVASDWVLCVAKLNIHSISSYYVDAGGVYTLEFKKYEEEDPELLKERIDGLEADVNSIKENLSLKGGVELQYNHPNVKFLSNGNYIEANLNGMSANANPVFNFSKWTYNGVSRSNSDDIAPIHIQNTTIGANHAQPCVIGTINSHGKTNAYIGTEWIHDNGTKFYIMKIVDSNNIIFLSENKGTIDSSRFTSLTTGTLTRGNLSMSVTSVKATQLYPSTFNVSQKILINGREEVTTNGTYSGTYIDIVEEYDIANPAIVLENIKSRVGSMEEPNFNADAMVHITNTYRFNSDLSALVIGNVGFLQNVIFSDIMISQSEPIGTKSAIKYYIPNSISNSKFDFTKPNSYPWDGSLGSAVITTEEASDVNNLPNRVIQLSDRIGFALGFLPLGTGKKLNEYANRTFEIRSDTGKVYPKAVESSKIGYFVNSGELFGACMYRVYFTKPTESYRICNYCVQIDNDLYVYVDYANSVSLDHLKIDGVANGAKAEIVESRNCSLKTDFYNEGIYIKADYIEGETSYIVLKFPYK